MPEYVAEGSARAPFSGRAPSLFLGMPLTVMAEPVVRHHGFPTPRLSGQSADATLDGIDHEMRCIVDECYEMAAANSAR
ncbi:hypothetical protein [Streptomyces sp. ME18-1-4]|uniref:hypothetical protein n=1 Tax=Streptomyces sp. ME18-1-4 TaxID=3028685 RepID=UPI0029B2ED1E|nr:hypothetical protein [Streptomyces sp. ME18-1-4]MDX3240985.1 hypothetical protein [Streptomyces sp. ME18-1-4]